MAIMVSATTSMDRPEVVNAFGRVRAFLGALRHRSPIVTTTIPDLDDFKALDPFLWCKSVPETLTSIPGSN